MSNHCILHKTGFAFSVKALTGGTIWFLLKYISVQIILMIMIIADNNCGRNHPFRCLNFVSLMNFYLPKGLLDITCRTQWNIKVAIFTLWKQNTGNIILYLENIKHLDLYTFLEMFCNIINVFTVTFSQFSASLLNKTNLTDPKLLNHSV